MGSYRLSDNAESDLYRIWLYGLDQWGLNKADTYVAAFFEHFDVLADNPFQYPAVDEIRDGYRRSVCGTDSVYYRIVDDETNVVEIMAIIGKQDTNQWL